MTLRIHTRGEEENSIMHLQHLTLGTRESHDPFQMGISSSRQVDISNQRAQSSNRIYISRASWNNTTREELICTCIRVLCYLTIKSASSGDRIRHGWMAESRRRFDFSLEKLSKVKKSGKIDRRRLVDGIQQSPTRQTAWLNKRQTAIYWKESLKEILSIQVSVIKKNRYFFKKWFSNEPEIPPPVRAKLPLT